MYVLVSVLNPQKGRSLGWRVFVLHHLSPCWTQLVSNPHKPLKQNLFQKNEKMVLWEYLLKHISTKLWHLLMSLLCLPTCHTRFAHVLWSVNTANSSGQGSAGTRLADSDNLPHEDFCPLRWKVSILMALEAAWCVKHTLSFCPSIYPYSLAPCSTL